MMHLITFFFLMFFGSCLGLIFIYFNKWMEEQSGTSFWEELKETFVGETKDV